MEIIKSDLREIKDQVSDNANTARRYIYLSLGFASIAIGVGFMASYLVNTFWIGVTAFFVGVIVVFLSRYAK